jgi:hypothetical protein
MAQMLKQSLMIVILLSILLDFCSHQKLEGCLWDLGGVTHCKRKLGGTLLVFSRFCLPLFFFFKEGSLVVLTGWVSTLDIQGLACHNLANSF